MSIAVSDVSSMYDIAVDLLDAVVAAMGTTDAGAPDRSFVSPGAPAFETQCDQAAVQVLSLTEEQTGPLSPAMSTGLRHYRGRVNLVGMVAYTIRCAEVSEGNQNVYQPLQDPSLDAQAKAVYQDGWAVWNHITRQINAGLLFGDTCTDVHFDLGVPYNPQGGLTGWQFTLRAELGGYVPAIDVGP